MTGKSVRMFMQQVYTQGCNTLQTAMAVAWKSTLNKALEANKHLKYSTFFQLATVRPDGKPSVRTVVFRGFLDESTKITFTTDTRYT